MKKKISEILVPIIFFNFKTAMNLKSESNVNASLSSESRLKVCVFTRAYMPGKGGLRWKDRRERWKARKRGRVCAHPPLKGGRRELMSQGSGLFQGTISRELVNLNLGKTFGGDHLAE